MKTSIVIPTYNHCVDLLKPCLEAIQKYTDLSDTEVIVVANGCTDDTQEYLKSLPSAFKPIWITEKVGYTKATNAGIKASTGDFVVLLNNDVFLLPQVINLWIDKLRSPFQDPQVGLVGVHKMQNDETKSSFYCFYCVMIKREVFDEVGLLDEIFSPGFGEDIDYCKRMQIAGYKLADGHTGSIMQNNLMVGDFPIHHPGSQSFHDDEHREKYEKIVQRNLLLLRNRYAGEKIKLNLGSGDSHIEGFLGIDLYDDRADLKADMTKLPFANESVEEIIAYHCLEHVTPYDINEVLEECNRVLIPGGKIAVEMPDLIEICKDFPLVPKEQKYVLINEMYGYGEHTGQHHYFGWYDEILMDHLFSHGFDNCVRTEPLTHINAIDKNYCMRIEANKKVNNPKYSIIIPTYNHLDDCLKPCIESISNNTNLKEVEVLVVANGCTNDTRTYVESLGDPFKLIWINEQVGFIKAVNKGMQISRGKYVIILNNDAFVIGPRWMHLLEQPFLNNQKAGISGPMKISSVFAKIKYMMFFCAMIKREVIETVGLLDERYGLGVMDDQDYCLRAIKAGYDVVQVPDEQLRKDATQQWSLGTFPIIHQSKSTFQQIFEKDKMHIKRNMHTFLDIHYPDEVVNIIIPTYNQHSLLKETLTSISNQTYPYIRVWVVSDGPDDIVGNIIDEYNEYNANNECILFTYLHLDRHEGSLGKCQQFGEQHLPKGSHTCFLTDHDTILPDYVEKKHVLKPKVYDCFSFFNELDLLELRLHELNDVVDVFVLSEARQTHSGKPKPLYFEENKQRFSQYLHKIKHIIVDFPETEDSWDRERYQRDQIINVLRQCDDKDIIILSDIDEIVSAEAVKKYNIEMGICAPKMRLFYYFVNCQAHGDWVKARILPFKAIGPSTLSEFRGWRAPQSLWNTPDGVTIIKREQEIDHFIENGGWHFSFLGNPDSISYKIDSYVHHVEFNETYNNKENIENSINSGSDVFGGNIDFSFTRIDETYPRYILENFDSLSAKSLISPNHNNAFLKYLEEQDESYQHITFHSIFEWNCYGVLPEELKHKTVIDIGGNQGWFSIFSILNGAEKCYCFEPNKITYQHLLKNIVTFKNIIPFNLAVTKPGLGQARTILDGIHCQINEGSIGELVNCTSIEKLLEQIPENNELILKLDCEGSEYDIIFNCSIQNLRKFKYIYAEVHNGIHHNKNYNYNTFEKFMNDAGFKSEEVTLKTPPGLSTGIWYNDERGVPSVFVPSQNVENPGSKMLKFTRIEQ